MSCFKKKSQFKKSTEIFSLSNKFFLMSEFFSLNKKTVFLNQEKKNKKIFLTLFSTEPHKNISKSRICLFHKKIFLIVISHASH